MRLLFFDIETAPSLAFIWELYNEVTSMEMIEKEWYCLCWSAKWLGDRKIMSASLPEFKLYRQERDNDSLIMEKLWNLLDEADVVVAHNAVKFDVRKVNTKFVMHGMTPPSPYKILDTLKIARKYFYFMSNRLGDLGKSLGVGDKMETGGFKLWRGCMNNDSKSWKKMVKYCKSDVVLLEKIYLKMRPYMRRHPNRSIDDVENATCPRCGSDKLIKRGTRKLVAGINQELRCSNCGSYSTIRLRNWTKEERAKILKNA